MSSSTVTVSWLEGPKSTKLFTRYYQAASPTAAIVFVHGFAEHCTRYVEFHTKLADSGVSVFTYDQRGFGKTALDEEVRSKGSAYGKTNWASQMEDLNWAVTRTQKELPGIPVYIMGQSMGGGEVLGFATEGQSSPYASTITSLSGVIATSPLIQQTFPANKILRKLLATLRLAFPYMLFPADLVPDELSRDKTVGEGYVKDPIVKNTGSLQGLHDMLEHGDMLKNFRWKAWPKTLPIMFAHGTADRITSPIASKAFHDNLSCDTKKYISIEGAFHELSNELPEVREQLFKEVTAFIEETRIPEPEAARL